MTPPQENNHTEPPNEAAALEHLTGPSRGTATWLTGPALDVTVSSARHIRVSETQKDAPQSAAIARLYRTRNGYEVEAVQGRSLWVNGNPVTRCELAHCDMIEFGTAGPLSRFCRYCEDRPVRGSISDIVADSIAYFQVSRRPFAARALHAASELLRRLALETTVLFRIGVVAALIAFAVLAYQQYRLSALLQQQVDSSAIRLESFAKALSRAREEALTPGDLDALRQELKHGLSSNIDRLEKLERRSAASARVIAAATPSVVFLQGAYGFKEKSSDRMLRHVVDAAGRPLISPFGQPLISLDGTGSIAERQYVGTGFIVGDRGTLITNRHIAVPWESDATAEAYAGQDLEPVIIRFSAYLPNETKARAVELVRASDDADLAIMRWVGEAPDVPGLKLAVSAPSAGDAVIVMGYPTGLRAMLAQAGEAFVEMLQKTQNTDFWTVATKLAEEGHIAPLASRGIVAHVTAVTMVYDADTTHGGSGGPVLNIDGEVVAVNAAILPEYGGSNLGVPAAHVHRLLQTLGLL